MAEVNRSFEWASESELIVPLIAIADLSLSYIRVKLRCFFQIRDNCWEQECLPNVIFSAAIADQNSMRTIAKSTNELPTQKHTYSS